MSAINSPTPADPEEREDLVRSSLKFPVVGIGASAGGVTALLRFFEHLPAQTGMAYVVILHLSPKHESNISSVLQRVTRIPVAQVVETQAIEADHIYVIAPTTDLTMTDGELRLTEPARPRGRHVAIDLFFRTLAEVHGERAVAIVMSGTGADGAVGLTRIKECGGITLAQTPEDAEYEGMPRAAIATGMVDIVLPVSDMPQKLVGLWQNSQAIELPVDADLPRVLPVRDDSKQAAEEALRDIMALLRTRTRHDFRHYKRATVLRRIERRLQVNGLADLPAYRDYLRTRVEETPLLLQDMLISVTNFFRDRDSFEALEREVIPTLFEARASNDPIRAWVPGCATGEEAYSIGILLREAADRQLSPPEINVFATDIDERAIATGRAGLYPGSIVTDVAPARLRQFFAKEQDHYRVAKTIRERVLFALHNVLRDPPFSRLDLICCRNLLIYLDREAQTGILEMFRFALKPEGVLFLGSSESADAGGKAFVVVDKKHRVYRSSAVQQPMRLMPQVPELGGDRRPLPETVREKRSPTYAELHQRALEQALPPSVLIDAQQNLLHLSEGAGRFLEPSSGQPSYHLLTNVQPELRLELRTALFRAAQSGQSVNVRSVPMKRDGRELRVDITVQPFRDGDSDSASELTLVIFDEIENGAAPAVEASSDPTREMVVGQLEGEVRRLKENLQDTIEHSETSNEELKASNEELQAINEELRSATEELETSKEELQSVNEELITVNYELKVKVEETGKINDDLNNLIASTDIATVFIDSGMRINRYTPRALDVFNLIASDIGRSLLDITHRLDYETLADDAAEVFRSLRSIERRVLGGDGRHYLARILPYRTTEDKIEGAVLTFIDVTRLRQVEEQVRVGEQRMRLAAESTRDFAIITMDMDGLITTWNLGAERAFGWNETEAVGRPTAMIYTADDRASGMPKEEMRLARVNGRSEDERWLLRKDGSTFYCSGVLSLLKGETLTESPGGYGWIARDMTEFKRLELARETLLKQERAVREKAQAANELKDQFLAVMSHELKHPLNLIHVNAELLVRLPQAQEVPALARSAETIRRTVLSQARIIDDLLDLSRTRTGKLNFATEAVPVRDIAEAIVGAMKNDAAARRVTVELRDGEGVVALCDPVRLEQILWNLLSNALKFTPAGGRVHIALDNEPRLVRITVADTGRGIAPDFVAEVFGMFSQENSPTLRIDGGMGIGLALVQDLAVAQGGRVMAESPGLGQGATFTVWLPRPAGPAPDLRAANGANGESLDGLRILLADDSADSLEAFAMLLGFEGAVVETVSDGRAALRRLETGGIDLLISDLGMPDMDGYQLVAEVRRRPELHGLPAVALSGYSRAADAERAVEQGFDAHLPKPTSLEQIKSVIGALRRRGNGA